MPRPRTRAAASSIGSGRPSRWRQIVATADSLPGLSSNVGSCACARSHEQRDSILVSERGDGIDMFTRDVQDDPSRQHDDEAWCLREQVDEPWRRRTEVLDVVEHEQAFPVGERVENGRHGVLPGLEVRARGRWWAGRGRRR